MQHLPQRLSSRQLALDPGESLFFHSQAGSALISTAGTLLVTGAPRWLGEQVVRSKAVLEPGQAHTLPQSGWVTVTAQHGGAVCVVDPRRLQSRAAWWAAWVSACAAVLGRRLGRYRSAKLV